MITATAKITTMIVMTRNRSQVRTAASAQMRMIATAAVRNTPVPFVTAKEPAHELMLALGVTENYDQTGKFIDYKLNIPERHHFSCDVLQLSNVPGPGVL